MPEANAHRPVLSADMPGCVRPFGKERRPHGPEQTLNNGWGRVKAVYAARIAEASAGNVSGTCSGRRFLWLKAALPASSAMWLSVRTGGARASELAGKTGGKARCPGQE